MKRWLVQMFILLLLFSLCAGLAGCTGKELTEAQSPPVSPSPEPTVTAGERAATRLEQRESGRMADGLRIPLPPPPAVE